MAKFSQVKNTTEKPSACGSGRPGEKRVPPHVTEVCQGGGWSETSGDLVLKIGKGKDGIILIEDGELGSPLY